jgi:dTDP-glucose 4,6-dehydratase
MQLSNTILVTGGAGFIGSNFVQHWIHTEKTPLVNLDKLTYAGRLENLASLQNNPLHIFVKGDINDREHVKHLLATHKPWAILNFAAESHVDRSITGPSEFIQTNIVGTFSLLEEVRSFYGQLSESEKQRFRFLHVSTDEVYGSLSLEQAPFREDNPYEPNSPYSASKAASDHLVRAYHHTYGLPTLTTNCSNNYGPFQFPEKFIPVLILNALAGKTLPIYGDGMNIRDWLYVTDHCQALSLVIKQGRVGETYNIGGNTEKTNLEVVKEICTMLDELVPQSPYKPHAKLLQFVKDRPGHDRRYAIDSRKIQTELQWRPQENFASGIRKTIQWYLQNRYWIDAICQTT